MNCTEPYRLLIWMNMPGHHQTAFFKAIRGAGINLVVHYYGKVSDERKRQGWEDVSQLPGGERYVVADISALAACPDWRDRIHIVPGYGAAFLLRLAMKLSQDGVRWLHWSEPAFSGLRWWLGYPRKRWYAGLVNRHAMGALAIGDMAMKDFRLWGIREEKIHFLPYAVPAVEVMEKDSAVAQFSRTFDCCFLFLGALCQRKGIDILLESFKKVVNIHHNTCLVLVGLDKSNGAYRQRVVRLGLEHNVFFRGQLPAGSIGSVLACSDVFILPSRFDGWGMVICEAASAGRAIIASDTCGAAHHLISNGKNGYVVKAGDVTGLADSMSHYAENQDLAKKHGIVSKEIFRDFTPEMNALRLLQIIRNLVTGGNSCNEMFEITTCEGNT